MQEFGTELCKIRTGKRLTQRDVEHREAELSQAVISRVESGHSSPTLIQLEAFARVLHLRIVIIDTGTRVTQ